MIAFLGLLAAVNGFLSWFGGLLDFPELSFEVCVFLSLVFVYFSLKNLFLITVDVFLHISSSHILDGNRMGRLFQGKFLLNFTVIKV